MALKDFVLLDRTPTNYSVSSNDVQSHIEGIDNAIGNFLNSTGSSTDTALVRWAGTGGTTLQDSGILVDNSDNAVFPANVSFLNTDALVTVGDGNGSPLLVLNRGSGAESSSLYHRTAGVDKWEQRCDLAAEDFELRRYVAGVYTDSPWKVRMGTGNTEIDNNFNLVDPNATFTIGNGVGTIGIILNKSSGGSTEFIWNAGGSNEWVLRNSGGNLEYRRFSGGSYANSPFIFRGGGGMDIREDMYFISGTITGVRHNIITATISTQEDDWDPTNLGISRTVRVTLNGSNRALTGIAAPTSSDNHEFTLINDDTENTLTMPHQSGSSALANQFDCLDDLDLYLGPGDAVELRYNETTDKWMVVTVTRASYELRQRTITGSATLDQNTYYFLNHSSAVNLTLPAPGNVGARIAVKYLSLTAGNEIVFVEDTASDFTFDTDAVRLCIPDEYVEFIDDGTNWHVKTDGRIPHIAVTGNTTQTVDDNSEEIFDITSMSIDNGSLRSNDTIIINRKARYEIYGSFTVEAGQDDEIRARLDVEGTNYFDRAFNPITSLKQIYAKVIAYAELDDGDEVEFYMLQDTGAQTGATQIQFVVKEHLILRADGAGA